jgi:hypothetical protein
MKKTNIVSLVLLFGTMSLIIGCATTPLIPERYIVQPDPDNPYQGTWYYMTSPTQYGNGVLVVQGMRATYYYTEKYLWTEGTTYIIDANLDEWRLDDGGDTLFHMDGSKIVSRFSRYKK